MRTAIEYPALEKEFDAFSLKTEPGTLKHGEVVGIVGPNAIGKTTFVKMLANVIKPTKGKVELRMKVSYKPQYIVPEKGLTVQELILKTKIDRSFFNSEIKKKLGIEMLEEKMVETLSGGELQRLSVGLALSQEADIFLMDEPSAFLDIEQRMSVAHAIRTLAEKKEKICIVVDHDILFQDYTCDRMMVFEGEPGIKGRGMKPVSMQEGMNTFLKNLGISFRRDHENGRPRANKPGSVKDQEQKKSGNYYYLV